MNVAVAQDVIETNEPSMHRADISIAKSDRTDAIVAATKAVLGPTPVVVRHDAAAHERRYGSSVALGRSSLPPCVAHELQWLTFVGRGSPTAPSLIV